MFRRRHDSGGDVVVECEYGDSGPTDREAGRCDDGREEPFKALPRPGQFRRNTRRDRVNLGTDMMGNKADDALALGGRKPLAGVGEAGSEPVHPQTTIGIEHDLNDRRLCQPGSDCGAERGLQHAPAAGLTFGLKVSNGHWRPRT